MSIIYKMTNVVNGKSYIGATTRSLRRRLWDHRSAARQGRTTLIAQALREFGIGVFGTQVLLTIESDSYDDLMKAEIQAIKDHGTLEPAGYNRTSGGLGTQDCMMLESTKLKIGKTSANRIPSEETRAKMSLSHKGKGTGPRPHMRGLPAWNRGIKASEETRKKLSEMRKGAKSWKARPIEFRGVRYLCIKAAVEATGFSTMQVRYRLMKGDNAKYLDKKETKQS